MGGYEYVAGGICSALGPIVGDSVGGNSHTKMQWGPMHPTWDSGYLRSENIAIHKYLIQIALYEISSWLLAELYTKDIKI